MLDALLHDVGGELVLGEDGQLRHDEGNHLGTVIGRAIRDDMLRHIVAVLVHDQHLGAAVQLLHDGLLVCLVPMLKSTLDHTAPIRMRRQLADTSPEAIENETNVLPRHCLNDLLDDVVSVLVLHDCENLGLEFLDQLSLLLNEHVRKSLLLVSA